MSRYLAVLLLLVLAVFAAAAPAEAQTGIARYVNRTDSTCGGNSPCYGTIQAAVSAVQAGDTIQIQAGSYVEQVAITGKNNTAGATEASRIIIEADPAAVVGSVVLYGAVAQCTNGFAIRLQQSKFITIRGLTITGAGGQAISLLGGNNQNTAIHVERNRIVGNGSTSCDGGITIARGNPDTLIVNNLIYANGRNGLATIDADGGPHDIIGNTIHGNGWSGANITRNHQVVLVNNAITGNGTQTGSTGGRFGVTREASTTPDPAGIQLLDNLICGNRLGEINGPALDATDSGNLTPTGAEGPGVAASPGCDNAASVYTQLAGPDDFTLATGSPAIDRGMDPRTLGLPTAFNPLLEADFAGNAARPKNGTGAPTALFDIGALEATVPDTQPAAVSFLQPGANAHLRQTVTVQAQATDTGSGVASLTLKADTESLTATLSPTVPPPAASVTATASWNTTTVADGTHTLTATATDQATNPGTAQRVVIVDNTPPDTSLTSGPTGTIAVTTATFTFTGADNLTPVASLVFAWRIDGGAWSAFSSAMTATVTNLSPAPHTFEVKARDLAGNEDPTPASRTFTVQLGPAIASVSPGTGPIGTFVTIAGAVFAPSATTVSFNGTPAIIQTLTTSQITTTVPIGTTTGPLLITTPLGSASVTFTVTLTGDFVLTALPTLPATLKVIAGDQGYASIRAGGSGSFTSLISLSTGALPNGVTASFGPPLVAPGSSSFLALSVANTTASAIYTLTVSGTAQVDGKTITRTAQVALEVLPAGTTAVTGRILTAESIPQPIPGVTVVLGGAVAFTDAAGNFVLLQAPPGPNLLFVDGRTASTPAAQFPIVETQITVNASGPTRVPFIIYLPKLDTANAVNLPTDAGGTVTQDFTVTTPAIPGLAIKIPAGTRIIGPDGNPVTQIIVTPVPIDRSPMPFPPGISPPSLFAIHPGGSVPSQPLPMTFPNSGGAPGSSADLYYFDLAIGTWRVWGTGTVSQDGASIVSDPGFGLPRFAWHFACSTQCQAQANGANQGPPPADNAPAPTSGEPVDLFTGRLVSTKVDMVVGGRTPIRIERTYWSGLVQAGFFGIGWNFAPYDLKLLAQGTGLVVIQSDQGRLSFVTDGPGRWINRTAPSMRGAVITQRPGDFLFQLRFRDGIVYLVDRVVGFSNLAALTSIIDRNGNTIVVTREGSSPTSFGRITRITGSGGRALTLEYDGSNRITSVTDPLARTVRYAYDALGRLETVTDAAGGVTRYAYDSAHRLLSITDPRSITYLVNEYEPTNGRVVRQTQSDGGVWRFDYTLLGQIATETAVTDPRGNTTRHRFTGDGFIASTTDPLSQVTSFEYATGSRLSTGVIDPLGRATRLEHDASGNVVAIIDPDGGTRRYTYEPAFSRVAVMTDRAGATTSFEYDARGNVTAVVDHASGRRTFTYDASGQVLESADPVGGTARFEYDAAGNLTAHVDPLGHRTAPVYDTASRRVAQTDPLGRTTRFVFDSLNQIVAINDARGGITAFAYDPGGNLVGKTDALGNTTAYGYDVMNRLTQWTDALGASATFTYDGGGRVTALTDRNGRATQFAYDALDRRTTTTYPDGSVTQLAYDPVGRLIHVADASGAIVNEYDVLGNLTTQTTPMGTVRYGYDVRGLRTLLSAPGVPETTYAYDLLARLRAVTAGPEQTTFDYDPAGRRTRAVLPNGVATDYAYDANDRLTGLTYTGPAGPLGQLAYAYDGAGNRAEAGGSLARTTLPAAVDTAVYDAAHRQLVFGDQQMAYDANGNLVRIVSPAAIEDFTWDTRHRLVGQERPGLTAGYAYDAFGRRHEKTVNGDAQQYVHDGFDVVARIGAEGVLGDVNGPRPDERLRSGPGTFVIADGIGSVLGLTDAAGVLVTRYVYDPFGATTTEGAAGSNAFQFTGRENDDVTGLYFYRARYYSPALMRFLSEDPYRTRPAANPYAYVDNNPLRFVDPLGLELTGIAVPTPSGLGTGFFDTRVANQAAAAIAEAQARGIPIQITESYRAREYQQYLYDKRASNPNPVARPGNSNHEGGLAMDVNMKNLADAQREQWREIANKHGLDTIPRDPNHWQVDPKDAGYRDLKEAIDENKRSWDQLRENAYNEQRRGERTLSGSY